MGASRCKSKGGRISTETEGKNEAAAAKERENNTGRQTRAAQGDGRQQLSREHKQWTSEGPLSRCELVRAEAAWQRSSLYLALPTKEGHVY